MRGFWVANFPVLSSTVVASGCSILLAKRYERMNILGWHTTHAHWLREKASKGIYNGAACTKRAATFFICRLRLFFFCLLSVPLSGAHSLALSVHPNSHLIFMSAHIHTHPRTRRCFLTRLGTKKINSRCLFASAILVRALFSCVLYTSVFSRCTLRQIGNSLQVVREASQVWN